MRKSFLLILVLAACRTSTGPGSITKDTFGPGALANYTHYSDDGNPWFLGVNSLLGNGYGLQSVLIRKSVSVSDGWVEAVVDSVDDGGLVLRFSDNENYYLLAIRDDAAPSPRNVDNLQVYRRSGEGQGGFVSLWRMNVVWPRGVSHRVRFEAVGKNLTIYLDSNQVGSFFDPRYLTGTGVGVRHYGNNASWVSRYRRLSWGSIETN